MVGLHVWFDGTVGRGPPSQGASVYYLQSKQVAMHHSCMRPSALALACPSCLGTEISAQCLDRALALPCCTTFGTMHAEVIELWLLHGSLHAGCCNDSARQGAGM